MQLSGKKIIVTGGASGQGATLVKAFAREGAKVTSIDITQDAGLQIAKEAGDSVDFYTCDISNAHEVKTVFDTAIKAMGGVDVLVNCAGISPRCDAQSISVDDWELIFAVNSRGTMLTNQAVFPYMKAHGGNIINFASATGVIGYPGKAHYAATKGAVLAWTRSIAKEWGRYNIRANAIAPGMWTPMYDKTRSLMTPEELAQHDAFMAASIPLGGKLGNSETDLAPVLVFLASDGSRFMTGQTFAIDGGALIC